MYSRWVNMAVVLLWLATMCWLVTSKVIPPVMVGHPPSHQEVLGARQSEEPVGWRLAMDGRPVGWAMTMTTPQPDGQAEISSRVHFDELPLEQLTPSWLRSLLQWVDEPSRQQAMDAQSVLHLDSLGRLTRFESTVSVGDLDELVCLKGELVGSQVLLSVRSGEFVYRSEVYLPGGTLVGDALQPQTRLPGLRRGQVWTVPVFSPLRPPNNPLEILHAEVEGVELLPWEGRMERVWLVVYRSDPGGSLASEREARGRLWVRRDGTVLQQEVAIFGSALTFSRIPADKIGVLESTIAAEDVSHSAAEAVSVEGRPLDEPTSPLKSHFFPAERNPSSTDHDPVR